MAFWSKYVFPKDLPAARREAHRHIVFSGTHNFRDLGGYETMDGKHVKWGVIYRSDALQNLSKQDLCALEGLHLQRVIDFRADFEREKAPDRLPESLAARALDLPIPDANSMVAKEIRERIQSGRLEGIDAGAVIAESYHQYASRFTPQFRTCIRAIVDAAGQPVLFHCTAGKDRTGFAAAVLLRILGVPPEVVLQDYLLTRRYVQKALAGLFFYVFFFRGKRALRLIQQLSSAEPDHLQTAFATIDEQYGSFERYVCDGLGLSEADVNCLRASLLEP